MPDTIQNEINEIKEQHRRLARLTDSQAFSLVCLRYFYKDEGIFEYRDYEDAFTDGANDGGIDLIETMESDDVPRLILVQSKLIASLPNNQDVIDVFTQIGQTYQAFKEHRYAGFNDRLKRILVQGIMDVEDKSPIINLVLFLGTELSEERKAQIYNEIERIEDLKVYDCQIFDKKEIEEQIKNVKSPKRCVDEDKIKYDRSGGHIKYTDFGLLVSVSANSLKDLYVRHKDRGLFEQNYRYFVRNKRIDDSIKRSISQKRDKFWFLNNGIIIGCKDFDPDGNYIKLYGFSIINGCQTTTLIGTNDDGEDFFLPCKIVKPENARSYDQFISEIAEASNSQKPISDRDLKSNSEEQRNLQRLLRQEEPKIYLEIKRGEKPLTPAQRRQILVWQYLKNDYYGQVILSFFLQSPCTARSNKKSVFADQATYAKIFRRPFDKSGIIDVLRILSIYKGFVAQKLEGEGFTSDDQTSVATHGDFILLGLAGIMAKAKRRLLDFRKASNAEQWEVEMTKDNLSGPILAELEQEDLEQKLSGFFSTMILEIAAIYSQDGESKTISNFFKSDSKYRDKVVKEIVDRYLTSTALRARDAQEFFRIFI